MNTVADTFAQAWKFHQAGAFAQAEYLYSQVLHLDPANADAWCFLGAACQSQGKLADAETYQRRAMELLPNHPSAPKCLGIVIAQQGRLDEAGVLFAELLHHDPSDPELSNNLGQVRAQQGRWDEALAYFRQALDLKPDYAEAHWNRALAWLILGDFEQGWAEYEWRWTQPGHTRRHFPQPLWDGSPLDGKTILLYAEQGLGDTIQFIRYLGMVKDSGGQVIVECQRQLLHLLTDMPGIDRLLAKGAPLPPFDCQAPLLSLPHILGTTLSAVPAPVPYLRAQPQLVQSWQRRLSPNQGLKVGIAWQGNPESPDDKHRSIPLARFAPLAQVEGVRLFSLQKGAGSEQLRDLATPLLRIMDLGSQLDVSTGAFMETAAVMMNLDLVISSDTSVPHLAGALGVPVWVALTLIPNCRWLLQREDCPWYPTMRLFRQHVLGDWEDVFQRIASELKAVLAGGSCQLPVVSCQRSAPGALPGD